MPGAAAQLFHLPNTSEAPAEARSAVRQAAGEIAAEPLSDALLCVTELVTNRVSDGHGEGEETLRLTVQRLETGLRVELDDPAAREPASGGEPGELGFGLYIVGLLADRWGIEHGTPRRVWFEKDL